MEIRVLARQGKGVREIARELGLSRNTVRKDLRGRAEEERSPRAGRVQKFDPFKQYLRDRVQSAHPAWLPATALLLELRELGLQRWYQRVHDLGWVIFTPMPLNGKWVTFNPMLTTCAWR
ncbi:hypothetical protein CBA19C6_29675 [Cupriavidus pauculus]|nr:hypothetical protein CBA19C6_29675 [Cupriavidus pauculus]